MVERTDTRLLEALTLPGTAGGQPDAGAVGRFAAPVRARLPFGSAYPRLDLVPRKGAHSRALRGGGRGSGPGCPVLLSGRVSGAGDLQRRGGGVLPVPSGEGCSGHPERRGAGRGLDRKSTRLNSSHI